MSFVRARSKEQKNERLNQIIDATLKIYDVMPYSQITLKGIANELDFTRANLYKYVSTKEEIFLKIIERDVKAWICDLHERIQTKDKISIEEFANLWSTTLFEHTRLIELFSILHSIIEKNVTVDKLTEFKTAFYHYFEDAYTIIQDIFPKMSSDNVESFLYMQLYFAMGLYPATEVSDIQRKAIEKSGMPFITPNFIDVFSRFIVVTVKGLL